MIVYFSGTGNSRYVAHRLGDELKENVQELTHLTAENVRLQLAKEQQMKKILVFPVYSWGVPPNILDFVRDYAAILGQNLPEPGIDIVMTCGDETAMAPEMLIKTMRNLRLEPNNIWSVIMPNNYVLLPGFKVDSKEVENAKLKAAPDRIKEIAQKIREGRKGIIDVTRGSFPRLKTRLVYPLFKRWGIFPKKWSSDGKCIGCWRCATVCPADNIRIMNGRPVWGNRCTSCVGCFHICPVRAIDYGRLTVGKTQYFCPLK